MITIAVYKPIVSTYFVLRDAEDVVDREREKLLFHIKTGDYFAMVATALGFVEERLATLECSTLKQHEAHSQELELIRSVRDDLQYLNTHYTVCPKTKSYSISSGRGRSREDHC